MRHQHAGLAIPDFPLAYGRVWPSVDAVELARINASRVEVIAVKPITLSQIHLQMTHRMLAVMITAIIAVSAWKVRRATGKTSAPASIATVWAALTFTQVALGAMTIWSDKAADVATAHVVLGALVFVTGVVLSIILFGLRREEALPQPSRFREPGLEAAYMSERCQFRRVVS
jgi:cytochrome c oxidase assembly protein subunit 15